ncbi:MAG TPA: glycosyltransferase [Streptosporangiaceae bacterium]|nr:glycosyltransferase [Streptosporangiaceae bacterium]
MKVVQIHNRTRSTMPGGENRVVDQEYTALTEQGHEVIRFERDSDDIERLPALKKAMVPAKVIWSHEAHRDLSATLRRHNPDVVHVHNTFPLLSSAVLYACRDAKTPLVATIHNYKLACASGDFFRNGSVCRDCETRFPLPALLHGCYRGSRVATAPAALAISVHRPAWTSLVSAYVFISAMQRDLLRSLRLPKERVFVKHNLIPRREMRPVPREPAVLYAGRLEEVKGVRVLMAAWDQYRQLSPVPGLRLIVAGSGPLEREVTQWASSRPSVELLGQVSAERCAELMSRARAALIPSIWAEPFGLVVVEAMAMGAPPIAAAHGSFVELITPDVDGVLVPPGDPAALARIIAEVDEHPEKYETYGRQARDSYEERFNPDKSLKQLLEIYRYAIAHPA